MPPTTYPDSRMATFWIGHSGFLGSDCCGQRLQIHMSADRHHADHAFGAGVRHQRLEHLMLVETELGGGLNPITVIHMVVRMCVFVCFEWDSRLFELHCCRRGAGAFSCFSLPYRFTLKRICVG